MVRKKWTVSECDKDLAAQIAEDFSVDPLTAYILVSRGITDYDEIEEFLDPIAPLMIDPFSFADMDKAVRRIQLAIDDFQKIAVFGDYDADGITATALMYSYLEMREANVVRYIPDRLTEGYGLSCDSVRELAEQGVKLIITVDNGISAVEEAELCKSLGVDLVVTDHHKVGEKLPDAVAVVNPHRKDCPSEFKDFSGVGVAFKLVSALEGGDEDSMLDEFGDLVAIGTVADVVNLKGENRSRVRYGLNTINTSPRIGLKVLLEKSAGQGKKIGASSAAFTICPRINATGRMGSAEKALDLLLCDDEITAERLVEEINSMNQARQKTETEIFGEVSAMLAEKPGLSRDSVIVVASEGWHQGV
ncbi:MAG: DHH family phosphoesterase, partial [Clostridia bacterium]|nr:DHH family phosphoesterase [Clostridia bacterium]